MALQLAKLIEVFERLWPLSGAEEWDTPGLSSGHPNQTVSKALLSVDVTAEVISEAKSLGCQLIISHHPVLFRPVSTLSEQTLKGQLMTLAIRESIALYSAHTNADIVPRGVSDILATAIGLDSPKPLVELGPGTGHGRIGNIKPISLQDFAKAIATVLPKTQAPIRVAGSPERMVSKVAVLGGAGDSFIPQALAAGADVLVTSDLRHHVSLDAITDSQRSLALIDISHFAAESLWLPEAGKQLRAELSEVEFLISGVSTDPWSFVIAED
jgi:dinuclear metal center YbgI/SA1388 family protein